MLFLSYGVKNNYICLSIHSMYFNLGDFPLVSLFFSLLFLMFCSVMVIFAQSHSFEFVLPDNKDLSKASTHTVSVGSQNRTSALFPIRPLVLGEIPISSVASDAVRKMVLVNVQNR